MQRGGGWRSMSFFLLELGLEIKKQRWKNGGEGGSLSKLKVNCSTGLLRRLPFQLTAAQKRVIKEIKLDMAKRAGR